MLSTESKKKVRAILPLCNDKNYFINYITLMCLTNIIINASDCYTISLLYVAIFVSKNHEDLVSKIPKKAVVFAEY